jgi:hypothetical protein
MQGVGAATDAHHKAARALGFNLSERSLPFSLDTKAQRRNETCALSNQLGRCRWRVGPPHPERQPGENTAVFR